MAAVPDVDASHGSVGEFLRLDVGDGPENGGIERGQFTHRTDAIGQVRVRERSFAECHDVRPGLDDLPGLGCIVKPSVGDQREVRGVAAGEGDETVMAALPRSRTP